MLSGKPLERSYLILSAVVSLAVVAVLTQFLSKSSSPTWALYVLALWISATNLSAQYARYATGFILFASVVATAMGPPSTISSLVGVCCVLIGVALTHVSNRKINTPALELLSETCDLPEEGVFDQETMSLDVARGAMTEKRVPLVAGREFVERLQHCGAFPDAQIKRIRSYLDHYPDRKVFARKLVKEGLLTDFQASYLHWGREDQLRFDRYALIEMIGRGGMSTVFRAMNMDRGDVVALKLMAMNQKMIGRAEQEMEVAKQLSHKNIVVAYHSGRFQSRLYIEMEYVSGSDLHRIVRRSGTLSEAIALDYTLQAARALQHAHAKGLIHRDVKPGNMLVTTNGVLKLADLGLACHQGVSQPTEDFLVESQHLLGTIEFMSPEQAMSECEVDLRTDIYSLGATLFFFLTGQTRVVGKNLQQQITNLISKRKFHCPRKWNIREEVSRLIDRLCAYRPDDRFTSMNEVITEMERLIGGLNHANQRVRVLIVEDNEDDMFITLRMLGKINRSLETVEATTISDCQAILQVNGRHNGKAQQQSTMLLSHEPISLESTSDSFARDQEINIVLLDLNLPDSSGLNTITELRKTAPNVPLVVMTGLDDPLFGTQCIEKGADDFLSKDAATPDLLERSIFMTLARCRVRAEQRQNDSSRAFQENV